MVVRSPFARAPGTIFPPVNNPKEGGARVDFRNDIPFDNQIEWHGVRFGWSRMALCPCRGFNSKTEQIDPACKACNGMGFTPVRTPGYFIDTAKTGVLNEAQQRLVDRNKCMIIRGLAMGLSSQPNMFAVLGAWAMGSTLITVRAENKLNYQDRLIYLDDVITHNELVDVSGGTLPTRYPVEGLNALISETKEFGDDDVSLVDGVITWEPGKVPADGTRVSVNYLFHPVFTVIDFVHLLRVVPVQNKKPLARRATPAGDPMLLPIQVVARLEHLPMEPRE